MDFHETAPLITYLIFNDSTFENYEKNVDDIEYILVWEKEEFVITMELQEVIYSDTGDYTYTLRDILSRTEKDYAMYLQTSGNLIYITREAWEDGYREEYYPQEGYGADLKTHTYYDLDDLK